LKGLRVILYLCMMLAVCLPAGNALPSAKTKRVLILFETESNLPAAVIVGSALRETLLSKTPSGLVDYDEFLDLDRFPGPEHMTRMADFLRGKYATTPIDVVIAAGGRALDFMLDHRGDLFPGASLTFVAAGAEELAARHLPPDVVGIPMHTYLTPTVDLAMRLQPEARQLVVVTGASDEDRAWEATARRELRPYQERLHPAYLSALPMPQLLREVGRLPHDAIVLYLTIFRDGQGQLFHPREAARMLSEASSAPVYGVYDTYLQSGIVGGHMDTFQAMGREAGRLALHILAGERPAKYRLGVASAADYVNFQQLQRWGIEESRLPPGTVLRFKDPSLWALYRWHIILVFGLIVILSGLVAALLIQARRRQRAEGELANQRRELAHLSRVATLGELSGALAHELNQPLTAILSNAEAAQRLLAVEETDLSEIRSIIADIASEDLRAGEVIRHLRSLFKKEEPRREPLDLCTEIAEVQKMLNSEVIARNVKVVTQLSPGSARVKGDRVQLQQVFLNLFMNACDAVEGNKPGDRMLTISAGAGENGAVQVCYADNGIGIGGEMLDKVFQPFVTSKRRGLGLGLAVCRSIIQAHGGQLWATNNASRGASFWIILPKALETGG
jgi:signal transduction histidine kinase